MKRIIGIFSVTMIAAVTFFNVSSILQTEVDINLASLDLIQSANAEAGGGTLYELVINHPASTAYFSYMNNEGELCEFTCDASAWIDCIGTGRLICTPSNVIYSNCTQAVCG